MLPVCILLLTQTIATNLYLSLGLIGALSIVRYRTPVKNQYELAYLFSLISIGIITGVNPLYSILLTLILIFIPIAYMLFNKIFPILSEVELSNSSGRSEMTINISLDELQNINLNPNNGKIIRIDKNTQSNEAYIFATFDTFLDAINYEKKIGIKVKSSSLTNA